MRHHSDFPFKSKQWSNSGVITVAEPATRPSAWEEKTHSQHVHYTLSEVLQVNALNKHIVVSLNTDSVLLLRS